MRRPIHALLAALVTASLLSGCGFFKRHFERTNDEYRSAVQERPLEVPPDLDTPNSSGALVVPSAGARAAGTSTPASAGAAAPSETAPTALAPTSTTTLGGDGLHVADTVESAWGRVGLALERSGAATVLARDEAAHSYTVQTTGHTTVKPGWFKRAITFGRAGEKRTAQVRLTVRVGADGSGSVVGVEGANDEASRDAARSLLATLRERLN